MRILYDLRYASDHFTGIGTHAWQLLRALLAEPAGDTFTLIWRRGERAGRFDPAALRAMPGVTWLETDAPALGMTAAARTGELARASGADVYLSPFYLRPLSAGMPSVLTLHDAMHLAPEVGAPLRVRELFRVALAFAAQAEAVVTSSEFSRGEIARRTLIRPDRLHVAPLGVPEPGAAAAERPAGVPDGPFALVVGGNRPHKNLAVLARAWRSFGDAPPLPLVAAGGADRRFSSLAALGAGPHVHALGAVSEGALRWLYGHATLLVFPTLYEGFGLPLLEAASHGVPVLCSDIPVLRESGERFARFLPPHDELAWASAVSELAEGGALRERMAQAGREAAAAQSYAGCARAVRAVLQKVTVRP